jgi:PKD repeat protein
MARRVVAGGIPAACVRELLHFANRTGRTIRNLLACTTEVTEAACAGARRTLDIEPLEQRQLLSGVTFSNGVLSLSGSDGQNNTLTVTVSGSSLIAKSNSISKTVSTSSVSKIMVYGGNQADKVSISTSITKPVYVDGRYGNDSISTGNGNDTVYGDNGNDTIYGNGGNDSLFGEAGNDYVDGGTGTNKCDGGDGTDTVKNNGTVSSGGTTSSGGTSTSTSLSVTSIELWDASANKKLQTLTGGETLDLAKLPSKLTIVVQGSTAVASVKFGYDSNSSYRVESSKPWAIAGDTDGKLAAFNFTTGSHKLTVTPYSKNGATGSVGAAKTISFSVTRSSTTTTSGGGTTSSGTTGIQPRDTSASAPDAIITAISNKTIHAGQSFSAQALTSALHDGTPLTARYAWDFGDPGSEYNTLQGFNVAHVYNSPGTYTVKLSLTNEAGKTDVATTTVTVVAAGRKKIYVSNDGSDSNDGLSPSSPIKTWSKAVSKLADNEEILFNGGDTFDVKTSMNIYKDNVVVGSYGSGKATLKYSGPNDWSMMIWFGGGSTERTVQNLIFDSIYTGSSKDGLPQGIGTGGRGDTIRNNEFRYLGYGINSSTATDGLLVLDNTAPLQTGLRGYFAWASGSDLTYMGNYVKNVDGHVIRFADVTRTLVNDNDFTNPIETSGIRGTLTIHKGSYAYVSNNHFQDGKLTVGPLGDADGMGDKSARWNWAVFEGNVVKSQVIAEHGAQHLMYRNNIIKADNDWGFEVEAFNPTYNRGVIDVTYANNTVIDNGTRGNFLHVDGAATGINLINNLFVAPNLSVGTSGSAPVFVYDNDLSSFNKITGNVWPTPTIGAYAEGGINYVWPTWSDSRGYKTQSEWESYAQVGKDYYSDVSFNSTTYAPSSSSVAANVGIVWAGVFTDMNGKLRSNNGSWTAGAVEV